MLPDISIMKTSFTPSIYGVVPLLYCTETNTKPCTPTYCVAYIDKTWRSRLAVNAVCKMQIMKRSQSQTWPMRMLWRAEQQIGISLHSLFTQRWHHLQFKYCISSPGTILFVGTIANPIRSMPNEIQSSLI